MITIFAQVGAVGWTDDDGRLRRDREQGDRAEVFGGDALCTERTDPRVAVAGVCEVELCFRASCDVHLGYRRQSCGRSWTLMAALSV